MASAQDTPQHLQIGDEITLFGTDHGESFLSCPESVDGGVLVTAPVSYEGGVSMSNSRITDITTCTFQLLAEEKFKDTKKLEEHITSPKQRVSPALCLFLFLCARYGGRGVLQRGR